MPSFDVVAVVVTIVIILLSIGLHEFGHAKSADAAGDPTPRSQGRVTLNPLAHLDPLGTVMIVMTSITGFGLGWGRPVQVNPNRMENPKWDHFMSVVWGPLTNLIIAVLCAFVFRLTHKGGELTYDVAGIAFLATVINLSLFLFNLIPIGPLDGHWLLGALLPREAGFRFMRWNQQFGGTVLLMVILFDGLVARGGPGIIGWLLQIPAETLASLLLGI